MCVQTEINFLFSLCSGVAIYPAVFEERLLLLSVLELFLKTIFKEDLEIISYVPVVESI